jgi:hypothetical protein
LTSRRRYAEKPRSEWTEADFREQTEDARRQSRYIAAEERIKRIVDGMPALTDEQLTKLAALLRPLR